MLTRGEVEGLHRGFAVEASTRAWVKCLTLKEPTGMFDIAPEYGGYSHMRSVRWLMTLRSTRPGDDAIGRSQANEPG